MTLETGVPLAALKSLGIDCENGFTFPFERCYTVIFSNTSVIQVHNLFISLCIIKDLLSSYDHQQGHTLLGFLSSTLTQPQAMTPRCPHSTVCQLHALAELLC